MKALFVGIDPGSTSAVAAIDLDGNLVLLESRREFGPDEIISSIIQEGKPIVIASDRAEMPSTIENIASSLGAERFTPEEDLSRERKKELGEGENSHEMDALASARYAFNSMQKEMRKIKDSEGSDQAEKAMDYFDDLPERKRDEHHVENVKDKKVTGSSDLRSEIGELKKENRALTRKISELEKGVRDEAIEKSEIKRLEKMIANKNRELEVFRKKVRELEDRIEDQRKALELVRDGHKPVRKTFPGYEDIPEETVVESEELKERLNKQGFNARTVDELEGLELETHFIVEEFPEPKSLEKVLGEDMDEVD
ncbi:MAG: DUF460 domain-containing protein [Candidatus Nanohaloarchaea archaeon]